MRALIPIGQQAELKLETCIERLETENGDAVYETTAFLSLTSQIISDGPLSDQAVEDINCSLDGAQKRLCNALLDMERHIKEA